jgi:predicted HTH transcriptional regulator
VSPEPPSTPLGPFQIFQKLAEIFANDIGDKLFIGVNDTGDKFITGVFDTSD